MIHKKIIKDMQKNGVRMGESGEIPSSVIYDEIYKNYEKIAGTPYGKDGKVCTPTVKDLLNSIGIDGSQFIPSNMVDKSVHQVTGLITDPTPGNYVFYQEYLDKKNASGHVMIVNITESSVSIIHNGYNPNNAKAEVNTFTRSAGWDPHDFFISNTADKGYYKSIDQAVQ